MGLTSNDTTHSSYIHEVVECRRAFPDGELNSFTGLPLIDFVVLCVVMIAQTQRVAVVFLLRAYPADSTR